MINNYLKEVVKLPQASQEYFCDYINETCAAWWHGVCQFDCGCQVAPCRGCSYNHDYDF